MGFFDIRIDPEDTKFDVVGVAVAAVDAFSGQIVHNGIDVSIDGLPHTPIKNLSGMHVFVNLPPRAQYTINVQVKEAPYFNPGSVTFIPPAPDDPDLLKKRRLDIALLRRPTVPVDSHATTIVGVVVRPNPDFPSNSDTEFVPVQFASISAEFSADFLPPGTSGFARFKTLSDERGAFLLSLRLPADASTEAIPVKIIFEKTEGGLTDRRIIEKLVSEGGFHGFSGPVDIEGDDIPRAFGDVAGPELLKVAK